MPVTNPQWNTTGNATLKSQNPMPGKWILPTHGGVPHWLDPDGSYKYKCRSSGMIELTASSLTVRARNSGRAVIDGQQCAKRVLYAAAAGSKLVLDGLNVTGGREGDGAGGGMFIGGSSQVTVSNSRIYSNGARQAGAGIYIEGSAQVNITSTSIYSNTAEGTGGGGVAILGGNVSFDSCNIHDNQAYYGTYLPGAGVYISGSAHVIIANTGIYYNTASDGGGGPIKRDVLVSLSAFMTMVRMFWAFGLGANAISVT